MKNTHTGNSKAYRKVRTVIQIVFLGIFLVLMAQGKAQLWLVVFLTAGIGVSMLFSRIYCGWICPMGTLLRFQTWVYAKLKIKRRGLNEASKVSPLRWAALLVLLGLLVFSRQRGMQIPILPFMTILAVVISLVFHESVWHSKLCPFGALLSISSRASGRGIKIDREACIRCGKCERVCPSKSIRKDGENVRYNIGQECLVCRSCIEACPKGAIEYGRETAKTP